MMMNPDRAELLSGRAPVQLSLTPCPLARDERGKTPTSSSSIPEPAQGAAARRAAWLCCMRPTRPRSSPGW